MGRCLLPAAGLVFVFAQAAGAAPWQGHGENAQHTAVATHAAQNINRILWKTPIDLNPQIENGALKIHYASPLITAAGTVIIAVKTGKAGGYTVQAHNHANGTVLWSLTSGYQPPPHDWTPAFGPVLTLQKKVYFPLLGGLVRYRTNPDRATGATGWISFYGDAAFRAKPAAYRKTVRISTPLTADAAGNIYFGFVAAPGAPGGLKNGIARIGADGKRTWIAVATAAGDRTITEVQTNCAPAVSHDGKIIYIAVSDGPNNFNGYLLGLDSTTLAPKYRVRLKEPSNGRDAVLTDNSSASPTVGPDGDVYFGVRSATPPSFHNGRGWLLHFNATLTQQKTPGSFGWDDTVSIVPTSAVPSYKGKSKYLLMSKYNNYVQSGSGNGHNEIAILDPDAVQFDEYSAGKVKVMREVLTIADPTHFPNGGPGQVYEWCVNTVAVDPATSSVFAAAEDGYLYRWNLRTNRFSQRLRLNLPRGEAYTPTAIGSDGTVYAINDGRFYAVGN
jgi:hypothetical protein